MDRRLYMFLITVILLLFPAGSKAQGHEDNSEEEAFYTLLIERHKALEERGARLQEELEQAWRDLHSRNLPPPVYDREREALERHQQEVLGALDEEFADLDRHAQEWEAEQERRRAEEGDDFAEAAYETDGGKIDPSLSPRKIGRLTTAEEKFGKKLLLTYYAPPFFSLDAFHDVGIVSEFSNNLQNSLARKSSGVLEETNELHKYFMTQVANKTRQSQKTPITADTTNADFVIGILFEEFEITDRRATTTVRYKKPYVNDYRLSNAEQLAAAAAHALEQPKSTSIPVTRREGIFGITVSAGDMYTREVNQLFTHKFEFSDMTTDDSRAGPELRQALPERNIWAREKLDHVAYLIAALFGQREVTTPLDWGKNCKKKMKVGPKKKQTASHCFDAYMAMRAGDISTARTLLEELESQLLAFKKDRKKKSGKDKPLATTYYLIGILEEANNQLADAKEFYEKAIAAIGSMKPSKKQKFRDQISRVDSLLDGLSQWKNAVIDHQEGRIAYSNELWTQAQTFADSQNYGAAITNAQQIDSRFISLDVYTEVETFITQQEAHITEVEQARAEKERKAKAEKERLAAKEKKEREIIKKSILGADPSVLKSFREGWESSVELREDRKSEVKYGYRKMNFVRTDQLSNLFIRHGKGYALQLRWNWGCRDTAEYGYSCQNAAELFMSNDDIVELAKAIEKYYIWKKKAAELSLEPEGKVIMKFVTGVYFGPGGLLNDGYVHPQKRTVQAIYSEDKLIIKVLIADSEYTYQVPQRWRDMMTRSTGVRSRASASDFPEFQGKYLNPMNIPIAGDELKKLYAIIQADNLARERKNLENEVNTKLREAAEAAKKEDERKARIDAEFR